MARADLTSNLRSPRVHARRLSEAVVTGAGTALIAPGKMSAPVRQGFHALSGLAGGGATAFLLGQQGGKAKKAAAPAGGAVGLLMVGLSVAGAALDGKAERWLAGRGVKRPRIVIGAAVGLFTLATLWLEDFAEDEPAPRDLDTSEAADVPAEATGRGADDEMGDTPDA